MKSITYGTKWLLQLTDMVLIITHDYEAEWLFLTALETIQKEGDVLRGLIISKLLL